MIENCIRYCSVCKKCTNMRQETINYGAFLDMVFYKCEECSYTTSIPKYKNPLKKDL